MQPVVVVPGLHLAREAEGGEVLVQGLEAREDAGREPLGLEGRGVWGEEGGEGGGGVGVVGVYTDAEDDLVGPGCVGAVGQDTADLDEGRWVIGIAGV